MQGKAAVQRWKKKDLGGLLDDCVGAGVHRLASGGVISLPVQPRVFLRVL